MREEDIYEQKMCAIRVVYVCTCTRARARMWRNIFFI